MDPSSLSVSHPVSPTRVTAVDSSVLIVPVLSLDMTIVTIHLKNSGQPPWHGLKGASFFPQKSMNNLTRATKLILLPPPSRQKGPKRIKAPYGPLSRFKSGCSHWRSSVSFEGLVNSCRVAGFVRPPHSSFAFLRMSYSCLLVIFVHSFAV